MSLLWTVDINGLEGGIERALAQKGCGKADAESMLSRRKDTDRTVNVGNSIRLTVQGTRD